MKVLFDGRLLVTDTRVQVAPVTGARLDGRGAFEGNTNGLVGTAVPGHLELVTGMRYGPVGFRLVLLDEAPPPADEVWPLVDEIRPPVDEALLPVNELLSPASEARPLADEPSPPLAGEARSPVDEAQSPVEETLPPVGEALPSVGEVLPPVKEVLSSGGETLPPVGEMLSSGGETLPSVGEVPLSVGEAPSPIGEAPSSAGEGADGEGKRSGGESRWEDIVEVSFRAEGPSWLRTNGFARHAIDLPTGPLRVRYHARGMDRGRASVRLPDDAAVRDHYEILLWPAELGPDTIVREGSYCSSYAHRHTSVLKPPRIDELLAWGEPPLRSCLRRPGFSFRLPDYDPALTERLAVADPQALRDLAAWIARKACTDAGMAAAIPEIARALDHLDRREPLPPPFDPDDEEAAWPLLQGDDDFMELVYGQDIVADGFDEARWSLLLDIIVEAADEDPLKAAAFALWRGAASFGDDHRRAVLDEAAARFLA